MFILSSNFPTTSFWNQCIDYRAKLRSTLWNSRTHQVPVSLFPFLCLCGMLSWPIFYILIQTQLSHCLLPRHYDSWYLLHFWPPLIQISTFTSCICSFDDLIMSLHKSDLELHLVFRFALLLSLWDLYPIKHHWQRGLNLKLQGPSHAKSPVREASS